MDQLRELENIGFIIIAGAAIYFLYEAYGIASLGVEKVKEVVEIVKDNVKQVGEGMAKASDFGDSSYYDVKTNENGVKEIQKPPTSQIVGSAIQFAVNPGVTIGVLSNSLATVTNSLIPKDNLASMGPSDSTKTITTNGVRNIIQTINTEIQGTHFNQYSGGTLTSTNYSALEQGVRDFFNMDSGSRGI